jgi:hypothetical protein
MLFMSIITFEPEKRDEVIKRFAEKGAVTLSGRKVIGTWSEIGGNRAFRLVEIEDPKALVAATFDWSDLTKIEEIPVIETEEMMKFVKSKK